jgi:TolB-like protein/DNA-binding winged helix-turn-helix (wHTH) protein/Flp pilus assembly protein TadD
MDTDQSAYTFAGFTLDVARGTLSRGGIETRLRPKSFAVLRHLVEHPGRLVGKKELLDAVWGTTVVTEGSLTQCVIEIRRALGDSAQRLLRTVPRQGFLFDTAVTITTPSSPTPAESRPAEAESAVDIAADRRDRRSRAVAAMLLGLLLVAGFAGWFIAHRATNLPGDVAGAPQAASASRSIAVLRFLDLSPAGDQAYFADGLAEEILHLLAQSPDLKVIARSSSFVYEPGSVDIAAIAGQLDVAYVLEGSVRRAGDQLRITVQLIDTSTRAHVWSRTYDHTFTRVLGVQRQVAVDVAERLKVSLTPSPVPDAPGSAAAQDLYLLGRHLFLRRGPGDLEAAERDLEEAVALDPAHARAWTALAGVYHVRGSEELGDPAYRLAARRHALMRALESDPGLAEAHVRLAHYYRDTNAPAEALSSFERARQLAPRDPLVLGVRSRHALLQGRLAEAVELQRSLVEVDPLSAVYRGNLSAMLLASGLYEQALEQMRHVTMLSSNERATDTCRALLLLGRDEEARIASHSVQEGPVRDQLRVLLEPAPEATAAVQRLQGNESVQAQLLLAEIAAYRGEADAAFAHLEAAAERAVTTDALDATLDLPGALWLSPFLAPLREDARWLGVVRELSER